MKAAAFAFVTCLVVSVTAAAAPAPADTSVSVDTGLAWPVVERATRSADMKARAEAVRALGYVKGQPVGPLLTDSLADAQWSVRKHAIIGLVRIGDPKGKQLLAECLINPSLPMGRDAMVLVSELPAAEGRALFIKAMLDRANPARMMLIDNLLSQPADTAASWLAEALAAEPEYFTGRLKKMKPTALPAMLSALATDKNPAVAVIAVRTALETGVKLESAVLNALLKSKDAESRYVAAEALAAQGNADAVKVLLPLADGDDAAKLRFLKAAAAAPSQVVQDKALSMLKPETPAVLAELAFMCFPNTTDQKILSRLEGDIAGTLAERRAAAVRAIGKVKGTRALPQLNDLMLRDGNRDVRIAAAKAIGDLAQAESVRVLGQAADDRDIGVKMAVLEALGRIRDRSVVNVANYLAFDPHPEVKLAAIKAIAGVNHQDAMQVLRVATEEPNPELRKLVLAAMIRLDKDQALNRFDRMLLGLGHDPVVELAAEFKDDFAPFARVASLSQHSWAREAAIESMKYMPGGRAAILQEMALTSPYVDSRVEAMLAMGELEPAVAFENATALVKDSDPQVRAAAFRVVAKSANPMASELLLRGIEDPDEYVKAVAAAGIFERAAKVSAKEPRPKTGKRK